MVFAASLKSTSVSADFTSHGDDAHTKKSATEKCIFKYSGITVKRLNHLSGSSELCHRLGHLT